MTKWNKHYAENLQKKKDELAGKTAQEALLNKGATFLVSPANMSYETKASKVSGINHSKVIRGLEKMLQKHEEAE